MLSKIKQYWFLLGLALLCIAVVIDTSETLIHFGLFLRENNAHGFLIFLIFLISGLLIEKEQIKAGIRDFKATFLSLTLILIVAPLTALALSCLPLETGVIIGIFIVAAMPTTLSSGVVMTRVAGGNMAHALFITIISNLIGIFSIPVILSRLLIFLNHSQQLYIDQKAIIFKLLIFVLLPLVIGIFVKSLVFKIFHPDKKFLQNINQCFILGIVFVSLAGARQVFIGKGLTLLYIIVLVMVFHFILLSVSFFLVKMFSIKKGSYESIIFMGAQKTLPLSVMIQVSYFSEYGIALLVCVTHHIIHLLIDGYLSVKMGNNSFDRN